MEWIKAEIIQKLKEKWIIEFGDLNINIDSEPPNGYFVAGFVSSVLDDIETPAHSGDELWDDIFKIIGAYTPAFETELKKLKNLYNITKK